MTFENELLRDPVNARRWIDLMSDPDLLPKGFPDASLEAEIGQGQQVASKSSSFESPKKLLRDPSNDLDRRAAWL